MSTLRALAAYALLSLAASAMANSPAAMQEPSLATPNNASCSPTNANRGTLSNETSPSSGLSFRYAIAGTNLFLQVGSLYGAQEMPQEAFNSLIDGAIGKADEDAERGRGGRTRPLDNTIPFEFTVGELWASVRRIQWIMDFSYEDLTRVLLAMKEQMGRLNYEECLIEVYDQKGSRTAPVHPWRLIAIGYVNIAVERGGNSRNSTFK